MQHLNIWETVYSVWPAFNYAGGSTNEKWEFCAPRGMGESLRSAMDMQRRHPLQAAMLQPYASQQVQPYVLSAPQQAQFYVPMVPQQAQPYVQSMPQQAQPDVPTAQANPPQAYTPQPWQL